MLKILAILIFTITYTGCVNRERRDNQVNLSEAENINEKIHSRINSSDKIEIGYTKTVKKVFTRRSQHTILRVTIFTECEEHQIPECYLKEQSEEIRRVLQQEMRTYENFDQINFELISGNKKIQQLTMDI